MVDCVSVEGGELVNWPVFLLIDLTIDLYIFPPHWDFFILINVMLIDIKEKVSQNYLFLFRMLEYCFAQYAFSYLSIYLE